jgi:menaquinone-specific isochorismate synthase
VEEISRGRYAGPVGWVDIRSDGEFGIALRCGQIDASKKSIRIYAGCGIVAGSDPAAEYAESEAKLAAIQGALARH